MEIAQAIGGTITVELLSADASSSIRTILQNDISVYEIDHIDELRIRFQINRKDYQKLAEILHRKGNKLKVTGKNGLFWTLVQLVRRPVLIFGVLFLIAWVLFLPTRVFFIKVEGNTRIPTSRILAAAEDSGICFGAVRREVRSEKVKNALLSALPELQWAGVNTAGCVATISVQERSIPEQESDNSGISHIVAVRDGIIDSCTATAGSLLCAPGQAVQKGEVLISGYTDCGIYVRAEKAEGEIYAQTAYELDIFAPTNYTVRGSDLGEIRRVSLFLGKKRINFYKGSGISAGSCDKMYSEYNLTLPGGFVLPVKLLIEYSADYSQSNGTIPDHALASMLEDFALRYLESQMIAGSVLQQDTQIVPEDDGVLLRGEYVCLEMIGRVQKEQIGEQNGSTQ